MGNFISNLTNLGSNIRNTVSNITGQNNDTASSSNLNNTNNKIYVSTIDGRTTGDVDYSTRSGLNNEKFINRLLNNVVDTANNFRDSFIDAITPQDSRINNYGGDFKTRDVSIANRHQDAISNILDDTFNGNIFEAGLSALELYNIGTKWTIVEDQYVDKDSYPFRYWYYYGSTVASKKGTNNTENDLEPDIDLPNFLDTIEDPTILGYSTKINYSTSPLFSKEASTNQQRVDNFIYSARSFIDKYRTQHREMDYCKDYLDEFQDGISKIFEAPETLDREDTYKDPMFKNHYVYTIDGLEKLDNLFVDYRDSNESHEALTITLHEDVRLFTSRLAFLYRNLSQSYNMGKKLIPENLLRFDMYIKVSDIRNFTRGYSTGEDSNSQSSSVAFREAIRDEYSRVIYELKDCEFLFENNAIPSSLSVSGFDNTNRNYSNLKIRIKYRKVNRIFYSSLYDRSFSGMVIGDKDYIPSTEKYLQHLTNNLKFSPQSTKKRLHTTNNIVRDISLGQRFDTARNNGIFPEDNNDNAVERFIKGVGNEAVKSGLEVVSEGLQSVTSNIENAINNRLQNSSIRNELKNRLSDKIDDLGYLGITEKQEREYDRRKNIRTLGRAYRDIEESVISPERDLHPEDDFQRIEPDRDLHPEDDFQRVQPNRDLHPESDFQRVQPDNDLHPEDDFQRVQPDNDLHNESDFERVEPDRDLHEESNFERVEPSRDLHNESDFERVEPSRDLHPEDDFQRVQPDNDLHGESDFERVDPSRDLHNESDFERVEPDRDLHPEDDFQRVDPSRDLHTESGFERVEPDRDLHNDSDFERADPDNDLHPDNDFQRDTPDSDLHPEDDFQRATPNEDLHDDVDFRRATPNEDLHPEDDFRRVTPNEDLHPEDDFRRATPNEDLHPEDDFERDTPSKDLHDDVDFEKVEPSKDLHNDVDNNNEIEKRRVYDKNSPFLKHIKEDKLEEANRIRKEKIKRQRDNDENI